MRNISFALTTAQILAGSKTVTRRMGWLNLKPGQLLSPVRKGMGLKPGEKIERLRAPIRVISVRRERLALMMKDIEYGLRECELEGFGDHPAYRFPSLFVQMFCDSHKGCDLASVVTRIEFEYTSDAGGAP